MRLILSLTGGGLSGPATMRTLSEGSLTIGRGTSNDWVLPDPQQSLSRTHCAITAEGERFILTDLSSNGVFVNGAQQPTERDSRIVLTDGDFFRLGDFTIKAVLIDDGAGLAPAPSTMDFPSAAFPGRSNLSLGGRQSSSPLDIDPLDDPLGRGGDGTDPFAARPHAGFSHPVAHVAVNPRGTPDPFDVRAAHPMTPMGMDDEDMFRGLTPSSEWQGAPKSDHAPATSMAMPMQRVIHPVNPVSMDDFDALLGGLEPQGLGGQPAPNMPQPMQAPMQHQQAAFPPAAPSAMGMPAISLDDLLGDIAPGGFAATPAQPPQQQHQPMAPQPAPTHPAPMQPAPVAPPMGAMSVGLDDLLGDMAPTPPAAHQPIAAPPPSPPPAAPPAPHPQAPAFDAFDAPAPVQPAPPHMAPQPQAFDAFDAPAPMVPPPMAPAPQPVAPPPALRAPMAPSRNPFEDPEPLPGSIPPRAATPRPAAPAPMAAQPAAPPPMAQQPAPQPVPTGNVPAPVATGDMQAAFAAFLEGAGVLGAQIDNSDPAAALRAAGAVFRAMAEGVREVLISRAEIKGEMRVERTMISSHGNNALKFSVTPDDAVTSLLVQKRPGYMAPLAATREAFTDIKTHEIAVMAGVQTALMSLLKRFEPETLEKRLSPSLFGAVLPAARKARYWDGFREAYAEISLEAEDDFQSVFGRSFAQAYTEQTRKD